MLKFLVIQLIVDFWEDLFDFSEIPNVKVSQMPLLETLLMLVDVIVTGKNSQAILLLTNGTLATLNENSKIVLSVTFGRKDFKPSSKR